ncbi:MAG: GntR family transcriptional regulator [bacterium]|nr:GntR family transcriptional regulator [bacterium]
MRLNHTSLRQQVYEVLCEDLGRGDLRPGATINLDRVAERLGVSRTPLREALLRLENEGFVTIRPRSGVVVRELSEEDIRNLYQMIGALEGSVIATEYGRLTGEGFAAMGAANDAMRSALARDDFDTFYVANLEFHNAYLDQSANAELVRQVGIMKRRLYDFPRKRTFVKEWELASTGEHEAIVAALEKSDWIEAARLVRDVHWSFAVQEQFIRRYYLEELG